MLVRKPYLAVLCALLGCDIDLKELREAQRDAAGGDPDAPPGSIDAGDSPDAADGIPDGAPPDARDDLAMIPDGAAIGSCDPAQWVASASASNFANPPANAIDGLPPSRWSSGAAQSPGNTFDIDFGGFVVLSQVVIEPGYEMDGVGDYPRGVDVLVSRDGASFPFVVAGATPSGPTPQLSIDIAGVAARGLRLQLTQGASESWWTIHELRLGCSTPTGGGADAGVPPPDAPPTQLPDTGVNPNRAQWTATASHSDSGSPVGNALDDSMSTRWGSGRAPQYGDETFRLDLGATIEISQVWLTSTGGDYPSAYRLELSTDGTTYTTVARGLGSDVTRISFPKQAARYVRIAQIGSGYDHWWVINDIAVIE